PTSETRTPLFPSARRSSIRLRSVSFSLYQFPWSGGGMSFPDRGDVERGRRFRVDGPLVEHVLLFLRDVRVEHRLEDRGLLHEGARDHDLLDLVGPLVDLGDLGVAHVLLDG